MHMLYALPLLLELVPILYIKNPVARRFTATIMIGLNVASALAMVALLFVLYRENPDQTARYAFYCGLAFTAFAFKAINMARVYVARMQFKRLYTLSLQTKIVLDTVLVAIYFASPYFAAVLVNYAVLGLSIACLVSVYISYRRYVARPSKHTITDKTAPTVSVLIPAKDETEELLDCLDSITESDYPKLEIIVLDDCSTNPKTAGIIKQFANKGVRFVSGTDPGDRWLGKNNAYEELRKKAHGKWLIFMGTDVRVHKHTVRNVIDRLEGTQTKMISVMPLRAHSSVVESTSPLRFFYELAIPQFLRGKPPVMSSFWAVRADALDAFGGFKGVSKSIIPERHIAGSFHKKYAFMLANTTDLRITTIKSLAKQRVKAVRQRYPQSKRRLERVFLFALLLSFCALVPLVSLFIYPLLSVATLLLFGLAIAISERQVTATSLLRLCMSAPLFLSELLLLNYSMLKYEFGSVYWRGRNVCVPVMRVYRRLPKL